MSLFTFKQVSEMLECSPQNVYQKKVKLKKMGYIETDADGKEKINDNGFNYLLELRKSTMQTNTGNLNNTLNLVDKEVENTDNTRGLNFKQDFIFEYLQKQVEDLQKQLAEEKESKKYWQDLYIKQNEEFKTKIFPMMLDTEEGNKKAEENHKKGFFGFFRK